MELERPTLDLTPQYGDPFCVMSASVRHGGGTFDYLAATPLSSEWPSPTFASAGPGPALALVHRVHPAALKENDCVRRLRYDEWHGPHPLIRLYPTTDPTPGRTKLVVLDGPGRFFGADSEQTVYVEYRRSEGLDQGLTPDPTATVLACSAVVVHELADTSCASRRERRTAIFRCASRGRRHRARARKTGGPRAPAALPRPPPGSAAVEPRLALPQWSGRPRDGGGDGQLLGRDRRQPGAIGPGRVLRPACQAGDQPHRGVHRPRHAAGPVRRAPGGPPG